MDIIVTFSTERNQVALVRDRPASRAELLLVDNRTGDLLPPSPKDDAFVLPEINHVSLTERPLLQQPLHQFAAFDVELGLLL